MPRHRSRIAGLGVQNGLMPETLSFSAAYWKHPDLHHGKLHRTKSKTWSGFKLNCCLTNVPPKQA
eukprot:2865948-Alexandrium_andersonii.AAC.1